MSIKIYYSNIPFWRAEVSRIALYIGNIKFEDIRTTREDFKEVIRTGKLPNGKMTPFRQLPVMEVNGQIIGQTGAIARYCGKISGLYPKEDNLLAAKIDQVIDAATDITELVSPTVREKNQEIKKLLRKNLVEEKLPLWFGFLEDILQQNNSSNCFVGKEITIADLAIWRLLGWLTQGKLDHIPTTILKPFKNLCNHFKIVDSHSKVSEWMKLKYGK